MTTVLKRGLLVVCPWKGHPLLQATKVARGVEFVAFTRDAERLEARGWTAEVGEIEVGCQCRRGTTWTLDLAKAAAMARATGSGYTPGRVVDFLV